GGGRRGARGHVDLEYPRRATATTTRCCRPADGSAPRGEKESDDGGEREGDHGRPAHGEGRGRGAGRSGQRDATQGWGHRLPLPLRQLREQALLRRRPQEGRLQSLTSGPTLSPPGRGRGEGLTATAARAAARSRRRPLQPVR